MLMKCNLGLESAHDAMNQTELDSYFWHDSWHKKYPNFKGATNRFLPIQLQLLTFADPVLDQALQA